jgi:hypothetical protein
MRNTISENEIENLLKDLSPISSKASAQALEISQKTNWNNLSQIINTYKENNMTDLNARKRLFNFRFGKLHWAFASLMIFAIVTGLVLYTKSNKQTSDKVAIDQHTLPTLSPTNSPTTQPKKDIKSIEDFKPIAAQKLQELTGASDKQIEDILKGIDTPLNEINLQTNQVEYTKTVYLASDYKNRFVSIFNSEVINSKPLTIESWIVSGSPGYAFITRQEDKVVAINSYNPKVSVRYSPSEENKIASKVYVTNPEVDTERYENWFSNPKPRLSSTAQALKDLLLELDTPKIYSKLELSNIQNESGNTKLIFTGYYYSNEKKDTLVSKYLITVTLDSKNQIISLKTDTLDKDGTLQLSTEIIESRVLDYDLKYFDIDLSILPTDVQKEIKTITWQKCTDTLISIDCSK